ncbi:hypothetical protein EDB84DRAFT_1442876 [Lactarius hengduanensis]|nr:hypothetical protein EDB84DRAFT_1442876 [Lactarius hengduanensis]
MTRKLLSEELRHSAFTFTLPPNVPTATTTLAATPYHRGCRTDTGPIRPQEASTLYYNSVGSVADSDVSGDSRVMMTSFKFPHWQESPTHKSVPLSLAQRRGTLNVAARPFTFPGLGGIDIGAIKKAALQATNPVSDGHCDGDVDHDGDGDIEGNDVDDEHELPIPLLMKARRAPIPLDFKHPISTNTVPVGLFKALGTQWQQQRPQTSYAGSCCIVLQQYEERFPDETVALHQDAAQLTHAELFAQTVTKADFEEARSMVATNSDLQVQLANLARLKTPNVTIERLLELKKLDRELNADKQALVSKNRLEDLRRANEQFEQLASLVSQVQMNEPELEDAQLADEQAEDRAAQLKPEYSPVRIQPDEKDAEERIAKDPENKLRDQVAALETRVAQLQARGAA